MSKRRTDAVTGFVNFPVSDPDYESTREGGLSVQVVVFDPRWWEGSDTAWMNCCGGYVNLLHYGVFVGADEDFHFPNIHNPWRGSGDEDDDHWRHRLTSLPYLAVINLGSTGWTGVNEEGMFTCSFSDLTEAGTELCESLKKLYPGCELYLLTWLDT